MLLLPFEPEHPLARRRWLELMILRGAVAGLLAGILIGSILVPLDAIRWNQKEAAPAPAAEPTQHVVASHALEAAPIAQHTAKEDEP